MSRLLTLAALLLVVGTVGCGGGGPARDLTVVNLTDRPMLEDVTLDLDGQEVLVGTLRRGQEFREPGGVRGRPDRVAATYTYPAGVDARLMPRQTFTTEGDLTPTEGGIIAVEIRDTGVGRRYLLTPEQNRAQVLGRDD